MVLRIRTLQSSQNHGLIGVSLKIQKANGIQKKIKMNGLLLEIVQFVVLQFLEHQKNLISL